MSPGDNLMEITVLGRKGSDGKSPEQEKQMINVGNIQHFRVFRDKDKEENPILATALYFIGNDKVHVIECGYDNFKKQVDRHHQIKLLLHDLSEDDLLKVTQFAEQFKIKKPQ